MKHSSNLKVGKKLKRIFAGVLSAAMVASLVPMTTFATTVADDIIFSREHFQVKGSNAVEYKPNTENKGLISVDFDVKSNTTEGAFMVSFQQTAKTSAGATKANRNMAALYLSPNGYMFTSNNGPHASGMPISNSDAATMNSGVNIGEYEANKTYHVTLVIDKDGNTTGPDGFKTLVSWYIDGKFVRASGMEGYNNFDAEKDYHDTYLDRIELNKYYNGYAGNGSHTNSETAAMDVDNIVIRDLSVNNNLSYGQVDAESTGLTVDFNETLAAGNTDDYTQGNDLTQVKIMTLPGEEVEKTGVSINGNKLTVNYNEGSIVSGESYFLVLPDNFKSVSDKVLSNACIRFQRDASDDVVLYSHNFDAGNITGMVSNVTNLTYEDMTGHGKALHMNKNGTADSIDEWRTIKAQPAGGSSAYGYSDEVYFSADYYFANSFTRTADFKLSTRHDYTPVGVWGIYFIDSYGNFVYLNGSSASNWTDGADTNGNYGSKFSVYTGLQTNKWYTVKSVVNTKTLKVTYYIGYEDNGEFKWDKAGVASVNAAQAELTNIQNGSCPMECFRMEPFKKNGEWKYGDFYIDNIEYGFANVSAKGNTLVNAKTSTNMNAAANKDKQSNLKNIYVVEADITYNPSATFEGTASNIVYFKSNAATNEGENVVFNFTDNKLMMSQSLINYYASAYSYDTGITYGSSQENYVIRFIVNQSKNLVSLTINNKHIRDFRLCWGNENNSSPGTYLTSNPEAGKFLRLSKGNSAYNVTLNRFSVRNLNAAPGVDNIVITDSTGNSHNIFKNNIPADISKVSVNFDMALGSDAATTNVKLVKDGEENMVTGVSAALSADRRSIVFTNESGLLANGKYNIVVNGVDGADDFVASFNVNDDRGLVFTGVQVKKQGENTYYPEVKATNFGSENATFTVIICEYTNDTVPVLKNIAFKDVSVNAGASVTTDSTNENGATITADDGSVIKTYIWSSMETITPIYQAVSYQQ